MRKDRLRKYDDSRSIKIDDDESMCLSDCTSCFEAFKKQQNEQVVDELKLIQSGDNSRVD